MIMPANQTLINHLIWWTNKINVFKGVLYREEPVNLWTDVAGT
jgi:hypothetical protein